MRYMVKGKIFIVNALDLNRTINIDFSFFLFSPKSKYIKNLIKPSMIFLKNSSTHDYFENFEIVKLLAHGV